MKVYIERSRDGEIIGVYRNEQKPFAVELTDEDDAEIVEFLEKQKPTTEE